MQSVATFIGGVGVTGILTTWYELKQRRKEKARQYFGERVLTEDFFRSLTAIWSLCGIYEAHDKVEHGETATVVIRGEGITIAGLDTWNSKMREVHLSVQALTNRMSDTGVSYLAPPQMTKIVREIGPACSRIEDQFSAGKDASELVNNLKKQLAMLSRYAREELGLQ